MAGIQRNLISPNSLCKKEDKGGKSTLFHGFSLIQLKMRSTKIDGHSCAYLWDPSEIIQGRSVSVLSRPSGI